MGELLKRDAAHHAQNVLERMKKKSRTAVMPGDRLEGYVERGASLRRCSIRSGHYGRILWITEFCHELRQNLAIE